MCVALHHCSCELWGLSLFCGMFNCSGPCIALPGWCTYNGDVSWWFKSSFSCSCIHSCFKGSRPALPAQHTTVVLHCSYRAAVHTPPTEVYIYAQLIITGLGDTITVLVSFSLGLTQKTENGKRAWQKLMEREIPFPSVMEIDSPYLSISIKQC